MGFIAVLPKTFSCAAEIGWFSLIILFGGHTGMDSGEFLGWAPCQSTWNPSTFCLLEKFCHWIWFLHCGYQMFQLHSSGSCGSNDTGGFFQFQPVCLTNAIVKLWNISTVTSKCLGLSCSWQFQWEFPFSIQKTLLAQFFHPQCPETLLWSDQIEICLHSCTVFFMAESKIQWAGKFSIWTSPASFCLN